MGYEHQQVAVFKGGGLNIRWVSYPGGRFAGV